jgi:tetratricopeptide (TPR) repeat protein/predicted Ser/Thr protein kinase
MTRDPADLFAAAGALDSGRYRLVRLLGRGGLGEVYLAHDTSLERDVAIKFVAPEKLADPDARVRLLREARAAAALDHPGICTVYETGEAEDGRGFIVMQYVEGETLAAALARGALPVREALTLCTEVAEALGAAHRKGIVHRDLKPGNIMVTPAGRARLVDFGIAKVVSNRPAVTETIAATTTVTTSPESTLGSGTPAYMSPEQIQQRPIDGRSDLFCLGLVLFECLTGRRAFGGRTALETMSNILHLPAPDPSGLRPELTPAHDELCRRLLAKERADRFQSADEVIGALRLILPDTSRTPSRTPMRGADDATTTTEVLPRRDTGTARTRRWLTPAALAIGVVLAAGIAGGAWWWGRGSGLPPVPPESDGWYQRGTEAIREGAYYSGRKALEQAVSIFPQHVLAYARLAEADAELDEARPMMDHLLRVSQLAPDDSRLPPTERLRLKALRALLLRDLDGAIAHYKQLIARNPNDAGAWIDLGRAQETAGLRTDARASYEDAVKRDRQSAVAYLRLGHVQALESRHEEALSAFAEAERLYHARSDVEGETEVLLIRGAALDATVEVKSARADLERALALATDAKSLYQQVRAQLSLSSVTASEGHLAESERMAQAAVSQAESQGLDVVAAGGLLELAATFNAAGRTREAETYAHRALALAEQRGAAATAARAKVELASIFHESNRPREALDQLAQILPFLKTNGYRRYELNALSIAARAHESLDELDAARTQSSAVLAMAEAVKDEALVAVNLTSLASITTSLGQYPEAVRLRERAEAIHRRIGETGVLPYDLTNRADLLIRLGRTGETPPLFAELDKGIAAGIDTYVGRKRRALFLRAFAAATALRCGEASALLDQFGREGAPGAAGALVPALQDFCRTRRGGAPATLAAPDIDPVLARERHYWRAVAALRRQAWPAALAESTEGLKKLGTLSNDELRWRLAAVAAAAATRLSEPPPADFTATARQALERLRGRWQSDFDSYARRADLVDLRTRAGLD